MSRGINGTVVDSRGTVTRNQMDSASIFQGFGLPGLYERIERNSIGRELAYPPALAACGSDDLRWHGPGCPAGQDEFPSMQQHITPPRHSAGLQGRRGLDHRRLVERRREKLRDAAARNADRTILLYLRDQLLPRRRMVG